VRQPKQQPITATTGSAPKKKRPKTGSGNWQVIREQVKYVDLLIEVCDARAPQSSRHANAREIFAGKPILLVLNKSDLADEKLLSVYINKLNQLPDQKAISLSLKQSSNKKAVFNLIANLTAYKREKLAKKGILQQSTRIGMPNVGKSSLINWLVGRSSAKAANKPGVTRGPQWVRIDANLELLDTPGILPKDNLDQNKKETLAILNLITEASDEEILANKALAFLKEHYLLSIQKYLDVDNSEDIHLESLARKRNLISVGGKLNLMRAASTLLTDLRGGKLGGICLDQELFNLNAGENKIN
jgi:ribosome biogenesis GTPase A